MRNRMVQILASVVSALLLAGPPRVAADTLEVTIHPTTNTDDQQETSPTLGFDGLSHFVVFTHVPSGSQLGDIHYQRVTATAVPMGSSERISSLATDDRLNDVDGTYIVYTALDPSDSSSGVIKLHDTSNAATVSLIPAADTVREARIHGDIVAWVQGSEGTSRIEMVDPSWPMLSSITMNRVNPAVAVDLGSRYVVWEESDGISANIVAYDLWLGIHVTVAYQAGSPEREVADRDRDGGGVAARFRQDADRGADREGAARLRHLSLQREPGLTPAHPGFLRGRGGEVDVPFREQRIVSGSESGARFEVHAEVERQLQLSRGALERAVPHETVPVQHLGVVVVAAVLGSLGRGGGSRGQQGASQRRQVIWASDFHGNPSGLLTQSEWRP